MNKSDYNYNVKALSKIKEKKIKKKKDQIPTLNLRLVGVGEDMKSVWATV